MRADSALRARLLGLCVAAGFVLAVVPPAIHAVVSQQGLQARAAAHALALATALAHLAARQPRLWRYNAGKVVAAASQHPGRKELGLLRILDCGGAELFSAARLGIAADAHVGPTMRAPIVAFGGTAGFVEVGVDASAGRRELLVVTLGSVLLGVLFGSGLYLLPARGIARSEVEERRRKVAEAAVAAQEREKRRVARDLHDGLGQHLTAARIAIELGNTEGALACTDDALAELRHAVFELSPRELDDTDAATAIGQAVERFELRTGIPAAFRQVGGGVADRGLQTCLLRIAQEALTNVARHAGATEVGVVLEATRDVVRLTIRDDGRGFDRDAPPDGTGIAGMKERAALVGGTLAIEATPAGTLLELAVPLRSEGADG